MPRFFPAQGQRSPLFGEKTPTSNRASPTNGALARTSFGLFDRLAGCHSRVEVVAGGRPSTGAAVCIKDCTNTQRSSGIFAAFGSTRTGTSHPRGFHRSSGDSFNRWRDARRLVDVLTSAAPSAQRCQKARNAAKSSCHVEMILPILLQCGRWHPKRSE